MALPCSIARASRELLIRHKRELPIYTVSSRRFASGQHSPIPTTVHRTYRTKPRNFSTSSPYRIATAPPLNGEPKAWSEKSAPRSAYPNFSLREKVYVVTGGGRGLGLVIAEAMVQAGGEGIALQISYPFVSPAVGEIIREANRDVVHCLDRLVDPDPEFLASQEWSKQHKGELHYHHVDVRNSRSLNGTVEAIAEGKGQINGLVAAAGVQQVKEAVNYTSEDVREMLEVNYTGVFMTANAVARQMMRFNSPGSMVLVASMSGLIANKGLNSAVYNSSKAAVIQLSRNLAMEWATFRIRVNALCPGHINTPMARKNFEEVPGLKETWERENMLHRLATPEEFTGATIFMLSDASSFMTGGHLLIDGGHTAW